jgi:hypothetical protein
MERQTVNAKTLANHYSQLTPEERFRLIVAASDRGDDAERARLTNASKRITFSNMDYSPFTHAFQELAMVVLLELLEEAAMYGDAFERWNDADMMEFINGKKDAPAMAEGNDRTIKEQWFELFLAQGFMLRTKAAGWKLFCERMGFLPFGVWQYLPGFERLQRDLNKAEGAPDRPGGAFTPKGMVRYLEGNRPTDGPEATEANIINAERFADSLDATFRERVKWWGG